MRGPRSASITSAAGLVVLASLAGAGEAVPGNPLIAIPGGAFVFGRDDGLENEGPAERIEIAAFAINRTEITNAQYRAFVAETGHRASFFADHSELGLPERPVVGVSWADAEAFCRHYGLALPSERQFERAARGRDGALHPWGDGPAATRANRGAEACCAPDTADGYAMTAPAASFPRGVSAEGVMDLVGNVWEWTADWYGPHEVGPGARAERFKVLRGGAWNSDNQRLTATYRLAYAPDFRFAGNGGFRCVDTSLP